MVSIDIMRIHEVWWHCDMGLAIRWSRRMVRHIGHFLRSRPSSFQILIWLQAHPIHRKCPQGFVMTRLHFPVASLQMAHDALKISSQKNSTNSGYVCLKIQRRQKISEIDIKNRGSPMTVTVFPNFWMLQFFVLFKKVTPVEIN